jgi:hypothetical protein
MTSQISSAPRVRAAGFAAALVLCACAGRHRPPADGAAASAATSEAVTTVATPPSSAEWLALLPDGEEKRRFVLDCTGCHQFDERTVRAGGRARTRDEWHEAVARMLSYAGASSRFPVISAYRDSAATADWLSAHLPPDRAPAPRRIAAGTAVRVGAVTEFTMPEPRDLPHDVAIDREGNVVGLTLVRPKRLLERNGELRVTLPVPSDVPAEQLSAALT